MTYLTVINKSNNVYTVRQVVTIICNTRDAEARCTPNARRENEPTRDFESQFFGYDSARQRVQCHEYLEKQKKDVRAITPRAVRRINDRSSWIHADWRSKFFAVRLCGPARNISIACYSKCTLSYSLVSPILFNPRCLMASGPFLIAFKNRLFFSSFVFRPASLFSTVESTLPDSPGTPDI